jgi:catechol 2,3-dioxygenase-like lactoylglutathione lyase family enzyme
VVEDLCRYVSAPAAADVPAFTRAFARTRRTCCQLGAGGAFGATAPPPKTNARTGNQPETCYIPGVDTPVGQLMNIVVDCPDADISARFWAAVLGWERVQETADSVDIADASDGRRRLVFQQIADYRPPGWPDQGPPQQLHLDVRVDDLEIADQRVRALGAVPLGERVVLEDETYRVYADPAGHPFCLVQLETT